MSNTDEEFFEAFKQEKLSNSKRRDIESIRPVNDHPMFSKLTKKKKKEPEIKQENFDYFDSLLSESNTNVMSNLKDALIGAVILFVCTTEYTVQVASNWISGLYDDNGVQINNMVMPKKISMKGRIAQMILFVILFVTIKSWFITSD